jgi:hypothetical protein
MNSNEISLSKRRRKANFPMRPKPLSAIFIIF